MKYTPEQRGLLIRLAQRIDDPTLPVNYRDPSASDDRTEVGIVRAVSVNPPFDKGKVIIENPRTKARVIIDAYAWLEFISIPDEM